ncbi:adenosylmethionine-8-amino-7-oxononanoate transaminase [Heliomicrobium modesticaldum Ice1]|uniref:Adenosylmethionine-8-amino-7-oxononanoate aminotransferase n=1 Tax=Heliobacterium modesticaldum (strain ATCC 51547 / Ice1) TaxID=498761 RepID=B0TF31_HELMI|nr:adenosylmethionine--8-amino-7-oxononanoate transaminase [Heliomicrobium modesticaldum]ABZ83014.1 adenosylmethionine-8-amino-7-oxononanoate transaminase [Heliomicrobium modesticaldum Ice1]
MQSIDLEKIPANTGCEDLQELDKRYLWHPFTQMREYCREDNLIIERGEGSYLFDTQGRKYLDGISSLWVTVHGHNRKEINEAIRSQAEQVSHSTLLGLSNVPATRLAKELVRITPEGLSRVFYSDSGATSVEIALKMAFQYWQQQPDTRKRGKQRFLTFSGAYHGDTIGSVSLGGMDLFHSLYRPLLFQSLKAPAPYCYRCPMGREAGECGFACLEEFDRLISAHKDELAAVVIEPLVQGAAGIITAPPGYLRAVRERCTECDVLLIADEVAVGFGRTGSLFACEQEGVSPDLMCLAKGITGGYLPLAATLATEKIYEAFLGEYSEYKTFFHGHSYTGNPLACAAALANLEIFERDCVIEGLQGKIERLRQGLEHFHALPHVGDVRQRGFMIGIELVKDKATKEPFAPALRMGHRVILEARRRGVILRPLGDVLVLMPILGMSDSELDQLLQVTYESIGAVMSEMTV